jgi:hypothetical protein
MNITVYSPPSQMGFTPVLLRPSGTSPKGGHRAIHPPPSQIRFAPVKPHGFPTFLHGKTPVFPTPFPKAKAFLRGLPPLASRRDGRETENSTKLSSLGGGGTVGDGGGLQATERSPLQTSNVGEGTDSKKLTIHNFYTKNL